MITEQLATPTEPTAKQKQIEKAIAIVELTIKLVLAYSEYLRADNFVEALFKWNEIQALSVHYEIITGQKFNNGFAFESKGQEVALPCYKSH